MTNKYFSFLISFLMLFGVFFVSYAEESGSSSDNDKPSIEKINAIYNNDKGELFIYGKQFGKSKEKIKVIITDADKKEINIPVDGAYDNLINANISNNFKNGDIKIIITGNKDSEGKEITYTTNSVFFDFKFPRMTKIFTKTILGPGEYITIEGENFRKPSYGIFGGEKFICEEETDKTCKFKIPVNKILKGKIGITSFGFSDESAYEAEGDKIPEYDSLLSSQSSFSLNIKNYSFEELRQVPKNESELAQAKSKVLPEVKMVIVGANGVTANFNICIIDRSLQFSCSSEDPIYYKGFGYLDFLGAKSAMFSYNISDIPLVSSYEAFTKWSTIQEIVDGVSKITEGNIFHIKVKFSNLKSSQLGKLVVFLNTTEYSESKRNAIIEDDNSMLIKLPFLPSEKGKISAAFKSSSLFSSGYTVIKSRAIPYDIGKYFPSVYEVGTSKNEGEFYIKGNNLTNFNDQETIINFGSYTINSSDKKTLLKREKVKVEKEIEDTKKKIEALTASGINVSSERSYIELLKVKISDIENGSYTSPDFNPSEISKSKVLIKSDKEITFKVYYGSEYGKGINKGEYKVTVTSNGIKSNEVKFYYNPDQKSNIVYAYPVIESFDYVNGKGNRGDIKIKGNFLQFIKEVYFTDEKVKMVSRTNDSILLNVSPSVQPKGPVTAKLIDNSLTNTLKVYEFFKDTKNKIIIDWKKPEKNKTGQSSVKITVPTLTLENLYKNVIVKSMKFSITSDLFSKQKLPFYQVSLKLDGQLVSNGVFEDKNTIFFENINLANVIKADEKKISEIVLDFSPVNGAVGDFKINILSIEFYNESDPTNLIDGGKIVYTKDPFFYVVGKGDGKFCIEKATDNSWVKCGEAVWLKEPGGGVFAQKFLQSVPSPKRNERKIASFSDVDVNGWYYPFLDDLYKRGIIEGYKNNTFRGANNITRGEAVKILLTARNDQVPDYDTGVESFAFQDIPSEYWGKSILEYSVRRGYLRPVKKFYPNKYISRAEAAKLIATFFERSVPAVTNTYFSDIGKHWVINYAQYLYSFGVVSGVGNQNVFNPDGLVTRAEFTKMISKSLSLWSE